MKTKSAILCAALLRSAAALAEIFTTTNETAVVAHYNGEWAYPQSAIASNVYAQVKPLYEGHWLSPFDYFLAVRGGGVAQEMDMQRFMPFVHFVSNNCAAISADWMAYETNDMVRFTTLSAVGFSGFDNLTNLATHVLSLYEADANAISWQTIEMLSGPDDPPDAAHYLCLNYDVPGVSNLVNRFKAIYVGRGEMDRASLFDADLSGEGKRDYLDMKAAGAL